jgi:hypothetical protein
MEYREQNPLKVLWSGSTGHLHLEQFSPLPRYYRVPQDLHEESVERYYRPTTARKYQLAEWYYCKQNLLSGSRAVAGTSLPPPPDGIATGEASVRSGGRWSTLNGARDGRAFQRGEGQFVPLNYRQIDDDSFNMIQPDPLVLDLVISLEFPVTALVGLRSSAPHVARCT